MGYVETLEACLSHPHYKAPLKTSRKGLCKWFLV